MIGQTISHYHILEKLGEGGMGVVYKANDIKLKRDVAIKFLPRHVSSSSEEKERFFLEAQSASALSHPNICVIHAIEQAEEETFIVMEYVEGRTLRKWMEEQAGKTEGYRKTGLQEKVGLAIQIAEGLEKAHEKGIIHRDVKAENIMVTPDGRVKVMDFGLAKLRGVSKLTQTGSTVGTMAYMSPEQVEGQETDHRTDIFSFGVALYELLSGKLPFHAEHQAAVMYEILNVDPVPLTELNAAVDTELNRIVTKCLEKNREERYQSMREVAVDLKHHRKDSEGKTIDRSSVRRVVSVPPRGAGKSRFFRTGVIVLLGAVVSLLAYLVLRPTPDTTGADKTVTRLTSGPGLENGPTWSPDGKFVAYASDDRGNLDIIIHPIGGGQLIRVVDSDADDAQPAWSPDGSHIAFVSARDHGGHLSVALGVAGVQTFNLSKGADIFLVPAFGGTPVKLVENGSYPAWSPDGKHIVFQSDRGGRYNLWSVSADGGEPTQLTDDREFDFHPDWSPDGKWIVYARGIVPVYEVACIPASGGNPRRLTTDGEMVLTPAWAPDGESILFSSNRRGGFNLWKIPFSGDSEAMETPRQISLGEGADLEISLSAVGNKATFATTRLNLDILEYSVPSKGTRRVTTETGIEDSPQSSPDGKSIIITSNRGGRNGLWVIDMNGTVMRQLSSSALPEQQGSWAPDGKQIAYVTRADHDSIVKVLVRDLSALSPREIASSKERLEYPIWSPDGRKISYQKATGGKVDIWVYSFDSGTTTKVTAIETENAFGTWSPDGKYLAFQAQKGDVRNIWTVPWQGGDARQITFGTEEHSHPQWSPVNQNEILYVLNHKNLCMVSLSTGKVTQLTHHVESDLVLDYPSWSSDGKKIYYSVSRSSGDIYILENY